MRNDSDIARAAKILSEKTSISICLPASPNYDSVAAATALYIALLQLGKNVTLASSYQPTQSLGLVGEDKLQKTLVSDGDQLLISFPYVDGAVDKVSYNIEGERFNLTIQPREGFERLNPKNVSFGYTGGKPDVIVTLYSPTLSSLGDIYTANKDQFSGIDIINIDRHFTNGNYGSINIVDKKISSISEIIISLLKALRVKFEKEIATNLYSGIVISTNNFTAHTVSADTFQAVAFLMNAGAVKKQFGPAQSQQKTNPVGQPVRQQDAGIQQARSQTVQPQQIVNEQDDEYFDEPDESEADEVFDEAPVIDEPIQIQNTVKPVQANINPQGVENKELKPQGNDNPKDWLKPKIFSKNRNLI